MGRVEPIGRGGGDNPAFIDGMAAWFDSLVDRLLLQAYFERAHKEANHLLSRGQAMATDGSGPMLRPFRWPPRATARSSAPRPDPGLTRRPFPANR